MSRLSVAIVSYNARDALAGCLDSVFASQGLDGLEVLVADNASEDGSAEMVAERFPGVVLVALDDNVGFSRANNVLWRRASGELVVFLNSDTVVPPDALSKLVDEMDARPELGAIGPVLRDAAGKLEMSTGRMLSLTAELRQKLLNWGYRGGAGPMARRVESSYTKERAVDWVSGACLMTRRSILEDVAGFDEAFFLYSEDVDLCARIRGTGRSVVFTPRVEITHLKGASMRAAPGGAWVESERSRLYFYEKHYGHPRLACLKLYLMLRVTWGYLFQPGGRGAYRSVLELVRSGATPIHSSGRE